MQQAMDEGSRTVRGKEQYVVACTGKKPKVVVYNVEGKVTPNALFDQFQPGFMIFLRSRNFHLVPTALRGCLLYLSKEQKLVKVLFAGSGRAHVVQLFPPTAKPNKFFTTLLQEGYLLQQQIGKPLGEFCHKAMGEPCRKVMEAGDDVLLWQEKMEPGDVVAVVDAHGFSKHRVQGPDVYTVNEKHSTSDGNHFTKDPWLIWRDHIPRAMPLRTVPVLYVFAINPDLYTETMDHMGPDDKPQGVVTIPLKTIASASDR
jgi:hypothetical protein